MAVIKKKIWPEYFDAVISRKKKYELRLNDFEINEGDTLVLEEWDPRTKAYTGRKIEKKSDACHEIQTRQTFLAKRKNRRKRVADYFFGIIFVVGKTFSHS